jgi:hypothetical protein
VTQQFFGKYRGTVENNVDPLQQGRIQVSVPAVPQMTVLKTPSGTVTINDLPGVGGITIETTSGAKIAITPLGIEINNGLGASIVMKGPKITINNGAMEII